MLYSYLQVGKLAFLYSIRVSIIIFIMFTSIKFLVKRKLEFKPINIVCEFAWVLTVIVILNITGIMGPMRGDFGTTSIFNGNVQLRFKLFEEGLSTVSLLNMTLFIPFGFFSPIVFKKLGDKWSYGILIGLVFSVIIEFIQTFIGRFVQLDDVLMNTIGTFIGYEIWFWLSKLIKSQKK
ncbi:VanZ family protein [Clostridium malenominatum]|uniref:VanZ family protein n=1 Tax=Clostridium malenominatum TaxID=1539 RepID=A0ABP3UCM0_9CLOT